jgi:hypothetical protein
MTMHYLVSLGAVACFIVFISALIMATVSLLLRHSKQTIKFLAMVCGAILFVSMGVTVTNNSPWEIMSLSDPSLMAIGIGTFLGCLGSIKVIECAWPSVGRGV